MIKKILILLFLLLITAYLIVAVTAFNTKPADQVCKGMELIIKDSITCPLCSWDTQFSGPGFSPR